MVGALAGRSTAQAVDADQSAGAPAAGSSPVTARPVGTPVTDPAPETLRLYAADWREFVAWCRKTEWAPSPASTATLAAYLLAVARRLSRGALGRPIGIRRASGPVES